VTDDAIQTRLKHNPIASPILTKPIASPILTKPIGAPILTMPLIRPIRRNGVNPIITKPPITTPGEIPYLQQLKRGGPLVIQTPSILEFNIKKHSINNPGNRQHFIRKGLRKPDIIPQNIIQWSRWSQKIPDRDNNNEKIKELFNKIKGKTKQCKHPNSCPTNYINNKISIRGFTGYGHLG